MQENQFENKGIQNKKELRKMFVEEYLLNHENKRPIEVGRLVTVLHGEYAHQGLMVTNIKNNGNILVLPTPESEQAVEFPMSEVCSFDDYHDAFKAALDKYKFTPEELGVDLPPSMNN